MDFDFLWVLNDKDIKVELLDKVAFLSTKPKTPRIHWYPRGFGCGGDEEPSVPVGSREE